MLPYVTRVFMCLCTCVCVECVLDGLAWGSGGGEVRDVREEGGEVEGKEGDEVLVLGGWCGKGGTVL